LSENSLDFDGQEVMRATRHFFLTQRSVNVLMHDGRGGTEVARRDENTAVKPRPSHQTSPRVAA